MSTVMWIVIAVVAGRMLQMYLSYTQSMAFNAEVKKLRAQGTVSVGLGGKRYRGGRAFVAIAVDDDSGRVVDAIALQGMTTFVRAKHVPALVGVRVNKLVGDRDIPGLSGPQRPAARQAAELYREATRRAAAGSEVSPVH